jgi:hypothetical protein
MLDADTGRAEAVTTYYVVAEVRNHPSPVPVLDTIDESIDRVFAVLANLKRLYPSIEYVILKSNPVIWGKP